MYTVLTMGTETTLRDFLIHYSQNEYLKRSTIIYGLSLHIEDLYTKYIINSSERTKILKTVNDIINSLNITYNERMQLLKGNEEDSNYYMSDESASREKKNLKKIENLDSKLSTLINMPSNASDNNFDIIDMLINSSSPMFEKKFYNMLPNDFNKIDEMLINVISSNGGKNIIDILSAITHYKNNDMTENSEIYDIIKVMSDIFVPLSVKKTNVTKTKKYTLKKINNVPDKYEVLLDNYYSIEFNIATHGKNKANTCVSIFGYFVNDCTNSIIRTSQICNKYIYDKKKYFSKLCYDYQSVKKKIDSKLFNKFNIIPDEFKDLFLKYSSVGNLLSWSDSTFIEDMLEDYNIHNTYSTSKNFKMIFSDFIQAETISKFKMIKYLLLGANSKDAAMLFNLMKESKMGSVFASDIMYDNLNLHLQTKLSKADVSVKAELKKLNKLSSEDIDMKTQIALSKNMPSKVKRIALEKLNELKSGNNEFYKYLTFVKTLIDYPWTGEGDGDLFEVYKNNRQKWKNIMEETNNRLCNKVYGHKECKETIVELLGKWFSNHKSLGKAVGLVGPPGVGKTLIAKELGDALGIPLVKINLGGMEDAAVLTGHSITYSGAVPGLIVKKMVEAGQSRCIVFFDELDKTCYHHGINEIAQVLIHVIDQTTNAEFNDKFFQDVTFPLNKVLFVFSFNDKQKIDRILLDRMEIIDVQAYTTDDKIKIVNDYLLAEIKEDFCFDLNVTISPEMIEYLIINYTREPGVRSIKRKLEKIFLKMNKDRIFGTKPFENPKMTDIEITQDLIDKYLTKPNLMIKKIGKQPEIGTVNGLYATTLGDGGIIPILMYKLKTGNSGKFSLKLTGKQGSVMKESVEFSFTISMNLIKDKYTDLFFESHSNGLHIHTPDGATPKDGPSAGSAFTLGFISIILGKKIKNNIGLTGEIERDGCITAIGGLEYKLPGAKNSGIKFVFVPKENEKDIEKIKESNPKLFDENFKYELVEHILEVLDFALIENNKTKYNENNVYKKLFNHKKYSVTYNQIKTVQSKKKNTKMPILVESESSDDSDGSNSENSSSEE